MKLARRLEAMSGAEPATKADLTAVRADLDSLRAARPKSWRSRWS